MSRPSKFNRNIVEELIAYRTAGLTQKSCARLTGITRATLYNWIKKGEKAKSGKYRDFYLRWLQASAEYELYHLEQISKSKDWKAHAYLLQVNDPSTYVVAQKKKTDANIKSDDTVNKTVDFDSDDFQKKELRLMKKLIKE